MKKTNNFNKIFLLGLIPIGLVVFVVGLLISGILYGIFKSPSGKEVMTKEVAKEHVCPEPEKVYVHDTLIVRVPKICNRKHVEEDKTLIHEAEPDSNESNRLSN